MIKFNLRRVLVRCLGIVIMGLGISLFKISLMGNDPSSAMVMALGDRLGIDFSVMLIIMNSLFFLVEILLGCVSKVTNRENYASQRKAAAKWRKARYLQASFSKRIAILRQSLILIKKHSTRCLSL